MNLLETFLDWWDLWLSVGSVVLFGLGYGIIDRSIQLHADKRGNHD